MSDPKLLQIIAETLEIPGEAVTDQSSSDTLDAWDSLKHLDIILNVEKAYNVKFKTSEMIQLVSVQELEKALRQYNVL